MKSSLLPIAQFAIRRSQFSRRLCHDQTNDYVRPMTMIKLSREHHRGPIFVASAPGNAPGTTSPGFNALPAPADQTVRETRA